MSELQITNNRNNGIQSKNSKAKNWVFTLNNWTEEDITNLSTRFETQHQSVSYICYKREICPNTGTKHLQGLICYSNRIRWNQARDIFTRSDKTNNSWLHTMQGTIQQSEEYVSKETSADPTNSNVVRLGTQPSGQGTRSDIAQLVQSIEAGARELDIFEEHPEFFIKHPTGVRRAIQIRQPKRNFKTKVYWFYGTSGSGKSQKAHEIGGLNAYYKNASMEFWEHYQNEEIVIIDDYRPGMCCFSEFLRLLDRYPHMVNVKGNFAQFNSKVIIITTPKTPRETWSQQKEENLYQLERRITQIVQFVRGKTPWSDDKQCEFVFDPDEEHIDREDPSYPIFNLGKRTHSEIQSVTD